MAEDVMNEIVTIGTTVSGKTKSIKPLEYNGKQYGIGLTLTNNKINKERKAQDLIRYSKIVEVIDEEDKCGYSRTYYLVDEHEQLYKIIKRNGKVDKIIRFKRMD